MIHCAAFSLCNPQFPYWLRRDLLALRSQSERRGNLASPGFDFGKGVPFLTFAVLIYLVKFFFPKIMLAYSPHSLKQFDCPNAANCRGRRSAAELFAAFDFHKNLSNFEKISKFSLRTDVLTLGGGKHSSARTLAAEALERCRDAVF